MPKKSKFFRVAVEGATTDGRTIDRTWIEQMAKNFDPSKYGARVWLEHYRGTVPDSPFRAYGDVMAVKAEDVQIDGKTRLALFAQIEPTPDLVAMTKSKQKIYTSIEVHPNFAESGEAYLTGLAVTDSPASLGTEVLAFAAKNPDANPFKTKKSNPEALFSEAVEADLVFEDVTAPEAGAFSATLKRIQDTIAKFSGRTSQSETVTGELVEAMSSLSEHVGTLTQKLSADGKALAELQAQFKALQEKYAAIDTTDPARHSQRPPATGGDPKQVQTDC
ncbi:GPO family capsid scaffolding protein [Aquabacterium sp.]|uniref:GPO family capsid scaffolding protein n=1 Tax=Aquabacterium sp. TaxID=1872578 RepID=UPI002605ED5A|nr:GPO family capsid scaffolding protein [Aquabacterium sp.]MDD2977893.1 GPO family capsid scaffolding protein [Aquabacterium sp.]